MPSFPNSIFSPASKNTGDTIQAAHVADLDSEVVAIEQGLRNGTAPLNSSNSTFTALSAGNSTVANLSVSSNSTFTGSVTFSSLVTGTAQPRCLVYSTASLALAANTFTAISFESEQFDVGGLHSTGTNPSRITIPAGSSGLYLCGATVHVSSGGAPDAVTVRIVKNSTTEVSGAPSTPRSTGTGRAIAFSAPMVLDGSDYLEVEVFPATSTGSIAAAAVRRSASDFWAVRLW